MDGTHFIGTTDNVPLDFRVNDARGLRLEYVADNSGNPAPKIIGGYSGNTVNAGTWGATISGGGKSTDSNSVTENFGTVSGGLHNSSGGSRATVGGGDNNTASGYSSNIGGGVFNTANGDYSTVGGGFDAIASGDYSTVGGGYSNGASGNYSTVPGGELNTAGGNYSFAAGRKANADHNGTFVWADNNATAFSSTGSNQFLIQASGGVGIGTAAPNNALMVEESVTGAHNSAGSYVAQIRNTFGTLDAKDQGVLSLVFDADLDGNSNRGNWIQFLKVTALGVPKLPVESRLIQVATRGTKRVARTRPKCWSVSITRKRSRRAI